MSAERGVFVYGTLRRGQWNARMLPDARVRPAVLRGELRYAWDDEVRAYPVFLPADHPDVGPVGLVAGEVVDVTLDEIPDVARMERGAGYEVERLEVVYLDASGELDESGEAWVFVWRRGVEDLGPRVPDDDFVEARRLTA